MKKIFAFLMMSATLVFPAVVQAQEKVEFALFVSPTCVHCNRLKAEYWPQLKEKYKDQIEVKIALEVEWYEGYINYYKKFIFTVLISTQYNDIIKFLIKNQ